jgi:hypothetical protein
MEIVTIRIRTIDGSIAKAVDVPLEMNLGDLKNAFLNVARISESLPAHLCDEKTGKILALDESIGSLGVQDGAVLVLVPEVEGGGYSSGDSESSGLGKQSKGLSGSANTAEGQRVRLDISAPIDIPGANELAILLVPLTIVERLEESRSDQRYWESITSALGGAVLGIFINWITGDPIIISKISILAVIMLSTFLCIALVSVNKYKRRADNAKNQALHQSTLR